MEFRTLRETDRGEHLLGLPDDPLEAAGLLDEDGSLKADDQQVAVNVTSLEPLRFEITVSTEKADLEEILAANS